MNVFVLQSLNYWFEKVTSWHWFPKQLCLVFITLEYLNVNVSAFLHGFHILKIKCHEVLHEEGSCVWWDYQVHGFAIDLS